MAIAIRSSGRDQYAVNLPFVWSFFYIIFYIFWMIFIFILLSFHLYSKEANITRKKPQTARLNACYVGEIVTTINKNEVKWQLLISSVLKVEFHLFWGKITSENIKPYFHFNTNWRGGILFIKILSYFSLTRATKMNVTKFQVILLVFTPALLVLVTTAGAFNNSGRDDFGEVVYSNVVSIRCTIENITQNT